MQGGFRWFVTRVGVVFLILAVLGIAHPVCGQVIPSEELIQKWSAPGGGDRTRGIKERGVTDQPEPPVVKLGEKQLPFDTDSARLLPLAQRQLGEVAKAMAAVEFAGTTFMIVGHADPRGNAAHNRRLSQQRALSVRNYLIKSGVSGNRLTAEGFGKKFARGADAATWALDRRVDILTVDYYPQYLAGLEKGQGATLAVALTIFQNRQGQAVRLGEGAALKSGDGFRVYFQPQQDCYVWIYQVDGTGKVAQHFPKPDLGNSLANPVKKGQQYWIPGFGAWWTLDDVKGEEKIYLVATTSPSAELDTLEARFRDREAERITVAGSDAEKKQTRLAQSRPEKDRGVRGVGGIKEEPTVATVPGGVSGPAAGTVGNFEEYLRKCLPEGHYLSHMSFTHQ